jgi:hypothetical protein
MRILEPVNRTRNEELRRNHQMRKLTLLGIATLFMLLLTQAATAQVPTSYKLCNKGKIEVRYATAIRSGNSLFGYSWNLIGWYPILPGKCDDAYHGSDKDPDEPIYVAIAFKDSTGVWGAATFPKLHGETTIGCVATFLRDCVHTESGKSDIDTKLCVAEHNFKYHLNGNINLPCESGYFPFKAALYLEPVEWQCSKMPGQPTYCSGGAYSFDFAPDDNSRAVAAGPSGSGNAFASSNSASASASDSSGPSIGTALGVLGLLAIGGAILADAGTPPKPFESGTLTASLLGKKIARWADTDSAWYYEDGRQVNTAFELSGKKVSWLMDAPEQRPTSDSEVDAPFMALRRTLGKLQLNRTLGLDETGRFVYSYSVKGLKYTTATNLSAMDYGKAKYWPAPNTISVFPTFEIPCRELHCVATMYEGKIELKDSLLIFFVEGDDKAVWEPLMKLADLYPAQPTVAVR